MMLHGYVIVIKRTGEDGSKFPVTEREVKIGTSAGCGILINTPFVASEHCAIIVQDDGQVFVKNLSERNRTVVNEEPLEDHKPLRHGDVLEIGGRLVRWEYLPESRHFRSVLQSNAANTPGKVKHCTPRKQKTPKTYTPVVTPKSLKKGGSNLKSPRLSRTPQTMKIGKDGELSSRPVTNMAKMITGRKSLQATKLLFSPVDKKRRKTEAIRNLNELDLLKITNLKLEKLENGSPVKASKQSTPIKRLSSPLVRPGKRGPNMKTPGLVTISETPLQMSSPPRLVEWSPSTPKGVAAMSRSISSTPPEVVTPVSSPASRGRKRQSPTTPPVSITVLDTPVDTPPEVVTPPAAILDKTSPSIKKPRIATPRTPVAVMAKICHTPSPVKSSRTTKQSPTAAVRSSRSVKTPVSVRKSSTSVRNAIVDAHILEGSSLLMKTPTSKSSTPDSSATSTPTIVKTPTMPLKYSSPNNGIVGVLKVEPTSSKSSKADDRSPVGVLFKTPTPIKGTRRQPTPVTGGRTRTATKTPSPVESLKKQSPAQVLRGSTRKTVTSSKLLNKKGVKKVKLVKTKERIIKGKITSNPDKNKRKALLLLGKASENKTKTELAMRKKLVKKAIKATTRPKTLLGIIKTTGAPDTSTALVSPGPPRGGAACELIISGSVLTELPLTNASQPLSRRSSKRISSKSNISRPDYTELSPTALGLTPKRVQITPPLKQRGRRSISLTTPKISQKPRIVSAISTSKKQLLKNVTISLGIKENTSHDSSFNFKTPNISQDLFVSPLTTPNTNTSGGRSRSQQKSVSKMLLSSYKSPEADTACDLINFYTPGEDSLVAAKSTCDEASSPFVLINKLAVQAIMRTPVTRKLIELSDNENLHEENDFVKKQLKSPRNSLGGMAGMRALFAARSSQQEFSCLQGVPHLIRTPKGKSNFSVLNLVDGVEKLLTPRSPKPDSTPSKRFSSKTPPKDLKNLREVNKTPKNTRKSQRNILVSGAGIGKATALPKNRRSPKNDLTNVAGVKKLLASPRVVRSPKNDLTNVAGVKKLLASPRVVRSPKNDLTNVAGVKKLLASPRVMRSPKNDLTNVAGVKKLLASPRVVRSPKNDLTNVAGVKKLLASPRVVRSPKNDLTNVAGVKKLLASPKLKRSPRNDLSDVQGVRRLFRSPKQSLSPRNDLRSVTGVKELFTSPEETAEGAAVTRRGRGAKIATATPMRPTRSRKPTQVAEDNSPLHISAVIEESSSVKRRGQTNIATPTNRSRKIVKTPVIEGDAVDNNRRKVRNASVKEDSPVKLRSRSRRQELSPSKASSPKKLKEPALPTRRGRPKRGTVIEDEATTISADVKVDEKPTCVGRVRTTVVQKSPVNRRRKAASVTTTPSPQKPSTRSRKAQPAASPKTRRGKAPAAKSSPEIKTRARATKQAAPKKNTK